LIGSRLALIDVDVEPSLLPQLGGSWRDAGDERPAGSFIWLEGSGTIPIEVPEGILGVRGAGSGRVLRLAFGGRTEKIRSSCVTLGVDLNGQPLARFVPFNGWREYRFPIPPNLLRSGRNDLAISAETSEGPTRFAVTYVRVAE
jgi:hypothetical protein